MKTFLTVLVIAFIIIGVGTIVQKNDEPIDTTMVESHIRKNIASLSPQDEVLGGVFFVTDITANEDGTGIVEYEDGHNAYTADFMFEVDSGDIQITSFIVR